MKKELKDLFSTEISDSQNFNSIKISLATEKIKSWTYGEIKT